MKILVFCFILAAVGQGYGQDVPFKYLNLQDMLQEILRGHLVEEKANCRCDFPQLTCSCCVAAVPDVNVCFSGSILPTELGVSWEVAVNGRVYVHGKFAGYPPAVCVGIPGLDFCIGLNELKIQNHTLSGCVFADLTFGSIVTGKVELVCVKLPFFISKQRLSTWPQPDSLQWNKMKIP